MGSIEEKKNKPMKPTRLKTEKEYKKIPLQTNNNNHKKSIKSSWTKTQNPNNE